MKQQTKDYIHCLQYLKSQMSWRKYTPELIWNHRHKFMAWKSGWLVNNVNKNKQKANRGKNVDDIVTHNLVWQIY